MKNKQGFTLIELLAVIIIISIIALIVVPNVIGIINDSKQRAYDIQVNNIKIAASDYITEKGLTISELSTVGGTYTITLQGLINLGYIDANVKNPLTNNLFDPNTTNVLITKTATGYTYVVNHD